MGVDRPVFKEKLLNRVAFQRGIRALVALAAVVIAFSIATPARAQGQFAIVNFRKCATEAKFKQELDAKFAELRKRLEAVFQKLKDANAVFLSPAEIKELAGLYEKPQPNDAEKKRIETLQQIADQRAGAARRLDNTATPTDEQKKELEKLAQMQQDGAAALQEVGNDFSKRVETQGTDFEEQLSAKVKEAVAAVAKEKNLLIVFDSNVVVYAAADITPDVIKILQK